MQVCLVGTDSPADEVAGRQQVPLLRVWCWLFLTLHCSRSSERSAHMAGSPQLLHDAVQVRVRVEDPILAGVRSRLLVLVEELRAASGTALSITFSIEVSSCGDVFQQGASRLALPERAAGGDRGIGHRCRRRLRGREVVDGEGPPHDAPRAITTAPSAAAVDMLRSFISPPSSRRPRAPQAPASNRSV